MLSEIWLICFLQQPILRRRTGEGFNTDFVGKRENTSKQMER
jgi:hypothetical protein